MREGLDPDNPKREVSELPPSHPANVSRPGQTGERAEKAEISICLPQAQDHARRCLGDVPRRPRQAPRPSPWQSATAGGPIANFGRDANC